jgi:hypothetical protein
MTTSPNACAGHIRVLLSHIAQIIIIIITSTTRRGKCLLTRFDKTLVGTIATISLRKVTAGVRRSFIISLEARQLCIVLDL